MNMIRINDMLAVGPQPSTSEVRSLADHGFAGLINARPDREEPAQPGNDAEREAAGHAGISYNFIPVTMATITEADVRAFQAAMVDAGGTVFAHCKTGARALTLHVLGEALDGRMASVEITDLGQRLGIDLSAASRWLDAHRQFRPEVSGFFDPRTRSVQYVVSDSDTRKCAIIDPVLDFDEKSGAITTRSADTILSYVAESGLTVEWILDTHPHADHFSAAQYLKEKTGAPTAIGARVIDVQRLWRGIYNWPELRIDGSQWDRLFSDGDTFKLGSIEARVMLSPGHTLASITYLIGDAAFVHDTIFMPDSGTARADFPGGDARTLWKSIQNILELPGGTRLFTGHDYQPGGRAPKWESTVGEQKRANAHLAGVSEEAFAGLREARDRTLPMPKLILHALQVNIQAGRLPEPEANGRRYLKFPLDALEGAAW
ncbi:bifunctional sulfur transferase/dioxygenase Blh [Mesorhizobium sp. B1-1-8]|uniref:bifunctional sulfur transferase/dioxygenase Blh n=1 Tax=Mesorhizobium sp. B1-1-8 TaxID=2589976 RepID=UPI001127FC42|nr:bifunctional sulfur transferase/dioxygenase Blh [Mesorhizobium sp. B1-1-8]UCI06795.1 TIGR01244 family phosphatase [Mesorhizobium sp. B1-1-8]